MGNLERALQIAVTAHAGQKDKNGEPYIFHPVRVMTRCQSPEARIVALLHDVVEDTSVTFDHLAAEGFSPEMLAVLGLLTRPKDVAYEDYIMGIAAEPLAVEVKLADLEDNCDLRRLRTVDDRSVARLRKYLIAYRQLSHVRVTQRAA